MKAPRYKEFNCTLIPKIRRFHGESHVLIHVIHTNNGVDETTTALNYADLYDLADYLKWLDSLGS